MSKGILKYYNTKEQENCKLIDSNSRMERRLNELKILAQAAPAASVRRRRASEEAPDEAVTEEGFSELDAESLAALTQDSYDEAGEAIVGAEAEEELAAAHAKAEEIVATAEQLAIEYRENSRREAEIECTRIRTDAREEGYQEGIVQAKEEYEFKLRELDMRAGELEREYDALLRELEPRFIRVITDIYQRIFQVELSEYNSLLVQLVAEAMRKTENSHTFIIHISSEDFPDISPRQREELSASAPGSKVEVIEDVGLGRNQCLLETDSGTIDCGLDTQLRELKKKLMLLSYTPDASETET